MAIVVQENHNETQDKALKLLADADADFDPQSPEAKAVLRKIDLHVMPILVIVYVLMLVDKNSISYAKIMGITDETGITPAEYSWLGSIV